MPLTEKQRAQRREQLRRWNAKHPERRKMLSRRWDQDHPEQAKANKKRWRVAHPELERQMNRRYRTTHPDEVRAAKAEWRLKNLAKERDRAKWKGLKSRYDLSKDAYLRLVESQHGRCAICRQSRKKLCVDQCHDTGIVRGLLCDACNVGLGKFGDSLALLRAAATYLQASTVKLTICVEPQ